MPGQKGLKTYKNHKRTMPKLQMGIRDINYNTKLMNSLRMQQK